MRISNLVRIIASHETLRRNPYGNLVIGTLPVSHHYRRQSSVKINPTFCCLSLPLPETIVTCITPFGSHARGAEWVVSSCHRSLSQSSPLASRSSILSSRPIGSAVATVPSCQSLSRPSCSRANRSYLSWISLPDFSAATMRPPGFPYFDH